MPFEIFGKNVPSKMTTVDFDIDAVEPKNLS
jgi:hypothetical protein